MSADGWTMVTDSLLDVVEQDPEPADDTSAFWKEEGRRLTVARRGDDLLLKGFGIGMGGRRGMAWQVTHAVERLSYWHVTTRLGSYPRLWRMAKQLARDLSVGLTFDVWKSTAILATLADHWHSQRLTPRMFAMIGDGNGFLGALIRRAVPETRMYCIDLPKALVFQASTHRRADARASAGRLTHHERAEAAILFVLPQDVEQIAEGIDCAVNIASMQEMTRRSIARYFSWLRRRSHSQSRFYCVNREEKLQPDGEVARFAEYPWRPEDQLFLDGLCPYYTHYLSRCMRPSGPTLFGWRVPLINYFDGPTRHRLVHLSP